jgi:predicted deacylase
MTGSAIPALDVLPTNSRQRGRLDVSFAEGDVTIAYQLLVGAAARPRLAVVAGVHGDEYDGILALASLTEAIDIASLAGSLLIVPVANPLAFAAAQRRTPADDCDLNRVFPGNVNGTVSERMAHALTGLLAQTDLVFTLHAGGAATMLAPWIEFLNLPGPVGGAAYAAAAASGFPDLIALPKLPGRLLSGLADRGVPVIEGEVGGRAATRHENVAYYRERVMSVARHAGVLRRPPSATTASSTGTVSPTRAASPPGTVPPPGAASASGTRAAAPQAPPPAWELCEIDAGSAGIFVAHVGLRQAVRAGDLLGEVIDPLGSDPQPVHAPAGGLIGAIREHAGVATADRVFTLWQPAKLAIG